MQVVIFTCISGLLFQRAIGAYQIAHFLRKNGFTVQVVDFTDHFSYEELLKVTEKYISENTLAVGISTTFYVESKINWGYSSGLDDKFYLPKLPDNLNNILINIKEKYQKVKIVLGGSKAASTDLPIVDKIINGYAEQEFLEYLQNIQNKQKIGNLYRQRYFFNIDTLDHKFAENDYILEKETIPIEISRGCIFKCKFCAFPLNGKSKYDYIRNVDEIKDEMIYNYEKYKITNYFFSDDTFNDSMFKVEKLYNAISSLPFRIKFTTYLRLDLLFRYPMQIKMLKEMGLATAFFGIESLNQKTASCIGKGMKIEKAKEFLLDLYTNYWNKDIPITCSFIIGLPYESIPSVTNTYEWIKKTGLSSMFFPLSITNKAHYKSEFDNNYEKYGYIYDEGTGYWSNNYMTNLQAIELADLFNNDLMRSNDRPSGWFLMGLLNNGYTYDEAKNIKVKDLHIKRIMRARLNNINYYKKMMLG